MPAPTEFELQPAAKDADLEAMEGLAARAVHPEHAAKLMLFGQFVGSWLMDIAFFGPDGSIKSRLKADWMFSWILQGRAVQDVLRSPCREELAANPALPVKTGSTLRYYDPAANLWRVVWVGAFSNTYIALTARKRGEEIRLEGRDMDGSPLQWIFSEIMPSSFRWRGLISKDSGQSWHLEEEMFGRRRIASPAVSKN